MEPALVIVVLSLLFGGTHIGLATGPIRGPLVARLGEGGFTVLFSLVASVSFAILVAYYAAHRFEGALGLGLATIPALRWAFIVVVTAGVMLIAAGSATYPQSPYDLFEQTVRVPRGVERITRHSFFVGFSLLALVHGLLATRLIGTVFFGGLALLAILGARHQDAKLLARRGKPYADYLAVTSVMPFAAVISGRQKIVWGELPMGTLAVGIGLTFVLRAVHDTIFAHGGSWIIASVLSLAAAITWQSWRRAQRTVRTTQQPVYRGIEI